MSRLSLSQLGETRTRVEGNHALIAPDGHVQTSLPGWKGTMGIILLSPQMGARFTQYFAVMQQGAEAGPPLEGVERFIYVVSGRVQVGVEAETMELTQSGYAYLPPHTPHTLTALEPSHVNVYERRYLPFGDTPLPRLVTGHADKLAGEPFMGDPHLTVRKLLPDELSFDMAVNTMTFDPGTPLPFVETHVMEHGLLMLSGGGIYRLADAWYPVQTGDVIWMGPYCPQWFGALGQERASYLLYKEANRDAFAFERES